jgi:hypothetical protein
MRYEKFIRSFTEGYALLRVFSVIFSRRLMHSQLRLGKKSSNIIEGRLAENERLLGLRVVLWQAS